MCPKITKLDKSLVGKYIDVLIDDSLHLSIYITDFEPDLDGLDCAEVVIFYSKSEAVELIGKNPGDIVFSSGNKIEILEIGDYPISSKTRQIGDLIVQEAKIIEFIEQWKNYDILKALFRYNIVRQEVYYYPLATPGMIVHNRNVPIKISQDIKSCEEIFNLIDNRRLAMLNLVFFNNIKINYECGSFMFEFASINQRDEVFYQYTSILGISKLNFNCLKVNEYYQLQKKGPPRLIL